MTQPTAQLDMFGHVLGAYAATAEHPMDNASLYQAVAQRAGLEEAAVSRVEPIGEAATPRNVFHRQVRWHQQSLKALGLIERVEGKRGVWQLTDKARRDLHPIRRPLKVIAFSTDLGVAMWSAAEDVFSALEVPITLCFTSPPYPLRVLRAYGNVDARAIVDFVCQALAPIIERMAPEASLVLNMSNEIFHERSPARSTYLERLTLALEDQFGLALMDRIVWHNPSKPPGPIQWASKTRQQLNVACHACNQAKGNDSLEAFFATNRGLQKRLKANRLSTETRYQRVIREQMRPLRDASAVNATRWALFRALKATDLPVSVGSGGLTKYNRQRLGIPKTHALDAACVGPMDTLHDWDRPTLVIKAMGRGSYQRTRLDRYGFTRGVLMREKTVQGFQTGDMVKAIVPTGKKAGTHVGRVAIRKTGSFNIQTEQGAVQGISWKHCTLLQRGDGYRYHQTPSIHQQGVGKRAA